MNHLILKYGYPITAVILAIFAWVVYRRIAGGSDIVVLVATALVVWVLGTPAFISVWPRMTVSGFRRVIVTRGLGGGPIAVNTLYVTPTTARPSAPGASILGAGTEDLLYIGGWLDLRSGPRILHTPDMAGRYYSLQFTDPSSSANFAYIGTRTTGSTAGDYLLTAPGWDGTVPEGMTRIVVPHASALVIGRVFVENERDLPAAYALATRIQLEPLVR